MEEDKLLVKLEGYGDVENLLLDETVTKQTVIALTGKSGIGKTALASYLYGRSNVRKHFQRAIWVHVPRKFRLVDLLGDIIRQAAACLMAPEPEREQKQAADEESIKARLTAELHGKKYLIVLDDVRSWEEWKFFLAALPAGQGSRVLVTTQLKIHEEKEAISNGHGHRYILHTKKLEKLDNNQAKDLFRKRVYGKEHVSQEKHEKMENLLQVQGLRLPLNVVMLAGLLRSKKEDEWEGVITRLAIESSPDDAITTACEAKPEKPQKKQRALHKPTSTAKILTVSVDDLPPHLKPCFLYFAAFTAEAAIDAAKLVRLWAAEGFLQPKAGQTMEERGGECLKELISRCLVHLVETDAAGNIVAVSVHQSVLDFIQSESRDTNFLQVHSSPAGLSRGAVRRLALRNTFDTHVSVVLSAPKLHSLLCDIPECPRDGSPPAADMIFPSTAKKLWKRARGLINGRAYAFSIHGSRFLRVMDLKGVQHRHTLPEEIGWLIHLRYLGLAHTSLKRLPKSVQKLRNLQTLDISKTEVDEVPCRFWRIRSLRHVLVGRLKVRAGPKAYHVLTDVRTLHGVPWGRWAENGAAIKRMTNLRSLKAWNIPKAAVAGDTLLLALAGLECLTSMDLEAANDAELPLQGLLTMLGLRQLQYLRLHGKVMAVTEITATASGPPLQYWLPNLAKLELCESRCRQDHIGTLARLPNLAELVLGENSYVDTDMVIPAGGFPELRKMQLSKLKTMASCAVEGDDYSGCELGQLRHVSVFHCESLQKFPAHLPQLSLFTVHESPGFKNYLGGQEFKADVVHGRMPSRRKLVA